MAEVALPWIGPVSLPVPLILVLWGIVEGLAIPLPMPGGVVLGGLAVAMRPTFGQMAWLSVYGTLGYCIGSTVGYVLGRQVRSHEGIQRLLARVGLGPGRLAGLEQWFGKHGQWAVAWSRPFWIGNYISFPAGLARMSYVPFLGLTVLGIYPTALAFLWAGDEAARLTQQYGTAIVWWSLAVIGAGVLGHMAWKRWSARRANY